jgi:hypothetical protein
VQALGKLESYFILNCDETSWELYPNGILTWVDPKSDEVALNVIRNETDCFTVMVTISLSRMELPRYLLRKGGTERCERIQFGEAQENPIYHSRTGWMTEEMMLRYIGGIASHRCR